MNMKRFFNNAGPSDPEDHYCLDPLQRLQLPELMRLIQQKRFFILHAPRQTGKTTSLLALMHHLNQGSESSTAEGALNANMAWAKSELTCSLFGQVSTATHLTQLANRGWSSNLSDIPKKMDMTLCSKTA